MTERLQQIALQESEKTFTQCEIIENAWSDEDLPKEEIEKFLSDNN